MDDNLEDAIPESDRDEEQAIKNPRIVIPENLSEMPDVAVVASEDVDGKADE